MINDKSYFSLEAKNIGIALLTLLAAILLAAFGFAAFILAFGAIAKANVIGAVTATVFGMGLAGLSLAYTHFTDLALRGAYNGTTMTQEQNKIEYPGHGGGIGR